MTGYWRRMRSDRALEIRTETTPADPTMTIRSVLFPDGDVITQIGARADAAQQTRHVERLATARATMRRDAERTALAIDAAGFALAGLATLAAWLFPVIRLDLPALTAWGVGLASTAALGIALRALARTILAHYIARVAGGDPLT